MEEKTAPAVLSDRGSVKRLLFMILPLKSNLNDILCSFKPNENVLKEKQRERSLIKFQSAIRIDQYKCEPTKFAHSDPTNDFFRNNSIFQRKW